MNKFSERLKELRKDCGLSQDDLALKLGISRNSIYLYETEKRTPNLDVLAECAMFFDVTSDYLLGISNNKKVGYDNRRVGIYDRKTDITRQKLIKRIDEVLTEIAAAENIRWIPVTPETMPPYTEYGASADLILRIREDDHVDVYTGYYQDGRWYTYMRGGTDVISEDIVVTHWMPAKKLLKGAEENG